MLLDCSPACVTQPPMICSTIRGIDAGPLDHRLLHLRRAGAPGGRRESPPLTGLPRAIGVRSASTMTASRIPSFSVCADCVLRCQSCRGSCALVGTPTPAVTSTWSFFFGWLTRGAADQPHALVDAVHAVDVGLAELPAVRVGRQPAAELERRRPSRSPSPRRARRSRSDSSCHSTIEVKAS